ncbi:MAG: ribosome silencing factor [Chloroflexi bacterium]|nr:ribosome silencing factor [Chloroflexota bacterium]
MREPFRAGASRLEAQDLAKQIVEIASEKQASDIIMLDLRPISLLADYFVICSGSSERQITAIQADIVGEVRNSARGKPTRQEGRPSSGWVLLDYGDVVVHIFAPAEREYYRLEEVWAEASPVLRMQ